MPEAGVVHQTLVLFHETGVAAIQGVGAHVLADNSMTVGAGDTLQEGLVGISLGTQI